MATDKLDRVFKTLLNKRVTDSTGKSYYNELGDYTINIHLKEIWTQDINTTPSVAVTDGVAQYKEKLIMTEDITVAGQQAWYAEETSVRLKDWISDKYGSLYSVSLYTSNDQEIFITDSCNWFFDYQTGILTFSGDISAFQKPFKITGYRYIGTKGTISSGDSSNGLLGTPTDGLWTDGIFDTWTPTTPINDAIDDISEILKDIAPARAALLTGATLASNIAMYTGKLSSGLNSNWYLNGKNPGDTITTYVITHTGTLTTPNASTIFRCGKKSTPSSYGTLKLIKNGVVSNSYDMSLGVGNNGILYVTAIDIYNLIWSKANAYAVLTLTDEGYQTYAIEHTEAGTSNTVTIHHDTSPGSLSFSSSPVVTVTTPVIKYLSGKEYLTLDTVLSVTYTAAGGIFNKTYHPTAVSSISCNIFSTLNVNPIAIPAYNDPFTVTANLSIDTQNVVSIDPLVTVRLSKPGNTITESTTMTGYNVCTYGIASTTTVEEFFDEDRRLILNTSTPFVSDTPLANGDAQVRAGVLEYGSTDYPDKTGNQEYQRMISKNAASIGSLTFDNIACSDISAYNTGSINILLYLESDNKYFDLGKAYGNNNGNGSGSSRENSIGARTSTSWNTTTYWSFGTCSTANNGNQYRIIIIFRDNANTITKITSA